MDPKAAYQALCVLCDNVRHQTRKQFHGDASTTRSEFISRGVFHSSMYVGAIEDVALKLMGEGTAEMLNEVLRVIEAGAFDGDLLAQTFESRVRALASDLTGERDGTLNVAMSALNRDWRRLAIEKSVDQYVEHGVARIGVAISTAKNRSAASVTNTFNVNAPTGAIVVGDGNVATVTQSLVTQSSPGEVKAALDALIQALQSAHTVPVDDREAIGQMLEQLKTEADSHKPNKRTVGTLIAGSRDVAELLVAAPGAWDTVRNWAATITANAVHAAPGIGQAIQNFIR